MALIQGSSQYDWTVSGLEFLVVNLRRSSFVRNNTFSVRSWLWLISAPRRVSPNRMIYGQKSLDRRLDVELEGRQRHELYRRIGLSILALVVVGALLNVFGQEPTTTVASARAGALSVDAPVRLRGGLIFQARFEITARKNLNDPRLVLSSGWLESMTLNTVVPAPTSEHSGPSGYSMSFDPLPAGRRLIVWTDWQVNPTNVARRVETATLYDGATPVASDHRELTVFP